VGVFLGAVITMSNSVTSLFAADYVHVQYNTKYTLQTSIITFCNTSCH